MRKLVLSILSLLMMAIVVSCDTSERDFEIAIKAGTYSSYDNFLKKHNDSDLADEARDSIVAIFERMNLIEIESERHTVTDNSASSRVEELLERKVQSLYDSIASINSIEAWQYFKQVTPLSYQSEAEERITALQEELLWKTEKSAWETALERDNELAYKKYIELYPNGKHGRQAEKKLIDIEVASVFAGEHGTLPQMDRGYSTGTSYSVIEIENRTQYELTVNYSGPDSKRMVIPSYGTKSMRIGNGSYRVAANVGHGVIPFAGTEYLDGSHYSSSFYISTTRRY